MVEWWSKDGKKEAEVEAMFISWQNSMEYTAKGALWVMFFYYPCLCKK